MLIADANWFPIAFHSRLRQASLPPELPGREAEIAGMYPGREVFRLSRTGSEADAGHVWERLRFAAPE